MAKTVLVKKARKYAGKCEKCLTDIAQGDPYKWIMTKLMGELNGTKRIRCAGCDDWHVWEWSPSISAKCQKIIHDTLETLRYHRVYSTEAGAEELMREAARDIRMLSCQRKSSAAKSGAYFGSDNHRTRQFYSEADSLDRWAKQIASWKCPPLPEPELTDCSRCSAKRMDLDAGGDADCFECKGEGRYRPDTPGEDQLDDWRIVVADDAETILEGCPL